jgi:hypothetical protein
VFVKREQFEAVGRSTKRIEREQALERFNRKGKVAIGFVRVGFAVKRIKVALRTFALFAPKQKKRKSQNKRQKFHKQG